MQRVLGVLGRDALENAGLHGLLSSPSRVRFPCRDRSDAVLSRNWALIATLAPGSTASIRSRTVTPYKAADRSPPKAGARRLISAGRNQAGHAVAGVMYGKVSGRTVRRARASIGLFWGGL